MQLSLSGSQIQITLSNTCFSWMHNSRNDNAEPCIKSSSAVKSTKMYFWAEETFKCTTLLTLALRCWAEECQILSPCCYLLSFSPGHLLHMTASFTCNKYNDCSWLCIFFSSLHEKNIAAFIHNNVSINVCHVRQSLSTHSLCCFIHSFYGVRVRVRVMQWSPMKAPLIEKPVHLLIMQLSNLIIMLQPRLKANISSLPNIDSGSLMSANWI